MDKIFNSEINQTQEMCKIYSVKGSRIPQDTIRTILLTKTE